MTIRELIHWDRPFGIPVRQRNQFGQSLANLQGDMNRLFEHFYNGSLVHTTDWDKLEGSMPAVNITENGKDFKVKADLAGMNPEDVEVEIAGGFLTIKGERKEEKEEKDESYIRQEMSYGSFQRTIVLPETANGEKAEASFKNGVLTIQVPKKADAVHKPKKLQIKKAA